MRSPNRGGTRGGFIHSRFGSMLINGQSLACKLISHEWPFLAIHAMNGTPISKLCFQKTLWRFQWLIWLRPGGGDSKPWPKTRNGPNITYLAPPPPPGHGPIRTGSTHEIFKNDIQSNFRTRNLGGVWRAEPPPTLAKYARF